MAALENAQEQQSQSSRVRFDRPEVLCVVVLVMVLALWRAFQPAVSIEAPPTTLEVTDLREVNENGVAVLEGMCSNKTGRSVAKAVFQVFYADSPVPMYVVVTDLKPGQNRGFRAPRVTIGPSPGPREVAVSTAGRKVVPYSIQWN